MRAVSSDTVARMLHVFVLHAPCEVAAPHESAAFDMQMHERLNAVPRGQLCLILGDFNARVGSIAADCFGTHAPVTENQNGERMRELLTESNMVALNTFFPGETLHMDESVPDWTTYVPVQNSLLIPGGLEFERTLMSGSAQLKTTGLSWLK